MNIPPHCKLADPRFFEPGQVDLLIGASIFWDLIYKESFSLGPNKPFVQNSKLGWFVSGSLGTISSNYVTSCNLSKNMDVQTQLERFWEIEEVSTKPILSEQEIQTEKHFCETFKRTLEGRFIVSIPLKNSPDVLGDSKHSAINQFYSLERKLSKNSNLKEMYIDFMNEYQNLNHMSPFSPLTEQVTFFSPHHGVIREDSVTTKLRVVFNSSARSSSGFSYNSIQMVGPVV